MGQREVPFTKRADRSFALLAHSIHDHSTDYQPVLSEAYVCVCA